MNTHSPALKAWGDQVCQHHIPRWRELPQIDLYMDQVVLLVEKFLQLYMPGDDKFITAAMINNYVKSKVLPPPVRKRYSREHIAYLVFICMLKQVLSIADIHALLIDGADPALLPQTYDNFCDAQEKAFAFIVQTGREAPQLFTGTSASLNSGALNMALLAGASKTMAQQFIRDVQPD